LEGKEVVWHIFAVIGGIKILCWILPWVYYKLFCCINLNNYKYGYVLITGSTDGIGKELSKEFAKKGFKLLLVSRNMEKLESVRSELCLKYPGNVVEIVACDFSNSHKNPENFYNELYERIKDFPISILINNVGVAGLNPLVKASFDELENIISVNTYPCVFLTHILLPGFIKRYEETKNRSLVINVGSIADESISVGVSLYSATKRFISFFSEGLRYEYKEIEVVTVKPGPIITNLLVSGGANVPLQCTSEVYAKSLLSSLRTGINHGHWKSKVLGASTRILPYMISILNTRMLMSYFIKIGIMKEGF